MATPHYMGYEFFLRGGIWPGDISGSTTVVSLTSGNSRMLLAFIDAGTDGITLDGVSMHQVGSIPAFYLMDNELPAIAGTYSFLASNCTSNTALVFVLLKDVNQASPITSSTTAVNLSLTVTSLSTNLVVDFMRGHDDYSGAADLTSAAGSGQTTVWSTSWGSYMGSQSDFGGLSIENAIGPTTVMDWGALNHGHVGRHHAVSVGVHPIIFGPSVQNN
jgi:hypothetical protein